MKATPIITATILMTGSLITAMSQNLDSMPQSKRDSILISVSKEIILKYGPEYYREYKSPKIERYKLSSEGDYEGKNANRIYYWIYSYYNQADEQLEYNFASKVVVWEDTGKPAGVVFGNGVGKIIPETELRSNEEIEHVMYQPRTAIPLYDWQHGKTEQNSDPVNMDELIKRGFVKRSDGSWEKTVPDAPPAEAQEVLRREGYENRNGRWIKTRPAISPTPVKVQK